LVGEIEHVFQNNTQMTNNDILRKIRYAFDFSDSKMIQIFAKADREVTREEVSNWMKNEEDPDWKSLHDKMLATFLNGLINDRRGKKEGIQPKPEKTLNNNIIMRKLKIALKLTDDDMLAVFKLVEFDISKHEINAIFRKPEKSQFRLCKDQFLRNFLHGMQVKYRKK
jgi:uncharacterized protein YehS (DUF1456 family)